MKKIKQQFKKGAASFYIVAFSTLILLIIATSFAAIIISEITRTQNDDLAQSAYDSALAGIEDAKLAVYNYQNCKADGATKEGKDLNDGVTSCDDIVYYIEEIGNKAATDDVTTKESCSMVANILDRVPARDDDGNEIGVMIKETQEGNNNMQQAYTCVQIQNILKSYNGTLSPTAQTKAVQLNFAKDGDGTDITDKIGKVKISWYEKKEDSSYTYRNFVSGAGVAKSRVAFSPLGGELVATPPTISVAMIQTAKNFNFSDFDKSVGNTTDRGMVYLVPTDRTSGAPNDGEGSFIWAWNGSENVISSSALVDSNNKTAKNLPYAVHCDEASDVDYACETMINLPRPVGAEAVRNSKTFMMVVSLPYGVPATNFQLEFYCLGVDGAETPCYTQPPEGTEAAGSDNRASLENVQIKIDSTGRANDLYRRVEAWLESASDNSYLSVMGPLELTGGSGSSDSLKKTIPVTCEYDFSPTCR